MASHFLVVIIQNVVGRFPKNRLHAIQLAEVQQLGSADEKELYDVKVTMQISKKGLSFHKLHI